MSCSSYCSRACLLLLLLVAGCADEPGCSEDYFTPEFARELVAVNTPDALLAASVIVRWKFVRDKDLSTPLPTSSYLLTKALQLAPDDEMLLAIASNSCGASNTNEFSRACSLDWATKLKDLDPENGFYWAKLAHYQLAEGSDEASLQSYQRAATAPTFSIGWGEQVYRLSMAVKEKSRPVDACSATLGASLAATNLPEFQKFTETCRSYSGAQDWRKACLDLGRNMETQSQTLASRMIGFALQRIVHEATPDDGSLAAVEARKQQLQAQIQMQGELYDCAMEDPEWIDAWLVSIRDFGEMETLQRMSEASPDCRLY